MPKFFYLACCHGNEPAEPAAGKSGSESSAAMLHRAGVPQVVGYYGPIVDELSTRAEEALYAAIAAGHTTRHAVRLARHRAGRSVCRTSTHRPGDPTTATRARAGRPPGDWPRSGGGPGGFRLGPAAAGTHPFAWAQLVFYHRGPTVRSAGRSRPSSCGR